MTPQFKRRARPAGIEWRPRTSLCDRDFFHSINARFLNAIHEPGSTEIAGTVVYWAPEVFSSTFSKASEVYSYAIVIWETLTGDRPWRADGNRQRLNLGTITKMVLIDRKRPEMNAEIADTALGRLVRCCWSHESEERPSFSEVVETLDGWLLAEPSVSGKDEMPHAEETMASRRRSHLDDASAISHRPDREPPPSHRGQHRRFKVEESLTCRSETTETPLTEPSFAEQSHLGSASVAELSMPDGCEFHAFLTHSWIKDGKGRDTHARVSKVNDYLKSRGIVTWFDGDRMEGQIVDQMVKGIDKSATIVVFLTTTYLEKVGSDNMADNCKKEFSYATRKKTASKMIPVPMEPACLNPSSWSGPVGMELGGLLYKASFPEDDEDFEAQARNLFDEIVRVAGGPPAEGGSAHPHTAPMKVQVPTGVAPGQSFRLQTHDGQMMQVTAPPGSLAEVSLDERGSLAERSQMIFAPIIKAHPSTSSLGHMSSTGPQMIEPEVSINEVSLACDSGADSRLHRLADAKQSNSTRACANVPSQNMMSDDDQAINKSKRDLLRERNQAVRSAAQISAPGHISYRDGFISHRSKRELLQEHNKALESLHRKAYEGDSGLSTCPEDMPDASGACEPTVVAARPATSACSPSQETPQETKDHHAGKDEARNMTPEQLGDVRLKQMPAHSTRHRQDTTKARVRCHSLTFAVGLARDLKRQIQMYPAFYAAFFAIWASHLISLAAKAGTGSASMTPSSNSLTIGSRVGTLPANVSGGGIWLPTGHTRLSLPPYYSLDSDRAQAYAIPVVYGLMHSSLVALVFMPVPMCHALWTAMVKRSPPLRYHVPVDEFEYFHRLLGVLAIGGVACGACIWLVTMGAACIRGASTKSCDAFDLSAAGDPLRNVVVLRIMIAPTWGTMLPLIIFAGTSWITVNEKLSTCSSTMQKIMILARVPAVRWLVLVGATLGLFFGIWVGRFVGAQIGCPAGLCAGILFGLLLCNSTLVRQHWFEVCYWMHYLMAYFTVFLGALSL